MVPPCKVVPLDELSRVGSVDLAINIHSFPECRIEVIEWWLDQIQQRAVPWLFIVTGTNLGLTTCEPRGRKDFRYLLDRYGFELHAHESKFGTAPALQQHGLYPDEYYLFRRRGKSKEILVPPVMDEPQA